MWFQWEAKDLILNIKVQTRSSRDEIADVQDDRLRIRIKAAPVDGKANQHLIKFLAKIFQVPLSRITLISGQASRQKRLRIQDPQSLPPILKKTQ